MSKMKAKFGKGSYRKRLIVVSLLLAILLMVVGSVSAFAAITLGKKFELKVINATGTGKDGSISVSLSETVNFQSDKVFVGSNLSSIYYLVVEATNMGTAKPLSLKLAEGANSGWKQDTSKPATEYTKYIFSSRNSAITAGTFNSLMSQLSVNFNASTGQKSAEEKVSIKGYNSDPTVSKNPPSAVGTYTCTFKFYDYAEGTVDGDTAEMDYKSDYAESYDSKYSDDVPDGQVNTGVLVASPDKDGGQATFDLYLTQVGGAKQINIGYQVKKSTAAWSTSIEKVYLKDEKNPKENKVWSASSWDLKKPVQIVVDGLEAGSTYTIRGVVATDGKVDTPKYTSELTFSYSKPNINSFNIGGLSNIYQGGRDAMNDMAMLATFNDTNAIGKTYQDLDGAERIGPWLKADVYFTADRNFESGKNGLEDHTIWYQVPDLSTTAKMTQNEGTSEETVATSFTYNFPPFQIPSCLNDVISGKSSGGDDEDDDDEVQSRAGDPNDEPINSTECAFKLVVTDMYTGYTTVTYSDCFTIDSGAPTTPEVKAYSGGQEKGLRLEDETVVGGSSDGGGNQVTIRIGNSDDMGGSGIKNYSYSMYSLATDQVSASHGTTREVLELLDSYTPNNHGLATYDTWKALSLLQEPDGTEQNMAELIIAKDGYYRLVARAEDEAGFYSEEVNAYFRVDLTAPNDPVLRLSKQTNAATSTSPTFSAYDNRTYTDSIVWAFAYSAPKTAKSLASFKFSTNSGLTWTDIKDIAEKNSKGELQKIVNLTNTTATVPAYKDLTVNTDIEDFVYQVGINLTALGYSDYTSILFKAVDTLGNESLVSNERHIRTTATVTTVASLSHDPIEVAMALGNTDLTMEKNIVPLKLRAARMINEKYYGTSGSSSSLTASDFNPYLYTKSHNCQYATDSGTGHCVAPGGCLYDTVENAGYTIYKPEWINISGLVSGVDGMTIKDWRPYDHNTNPSNSSDTIPISEKGRVTYYADGSGNGNNGEETAAGSNYPKDSACMQRVRHIIDMSASVGGVKGEWSNILFCGVTSNAQSDWLFYPFNQNTNKSIIFTMDTAKCNFHTYKQSGFWFNTTIREKSGVGKGNWVVSGYRLMIVYGAGSWKLTDKTGSSSNCQLQVQYFEDEPVDTLSDSGGVKTGTVKYTADVLNSTSGAAVQNFMIDLTGTTCTVYKIENAMNKSNMTVNYFRNNGQKVLDKVSTPRPKVNNHTIGDTTEKDNPFTDTNCYGFGPVIGYSSHGCVRETRVTFSNISISYNMGRTLSEVVTEPSWGDGKSRFILNLSDDPQADFSEPALTAQIQWRLNNDHARYIGWGISQQRQGTIDFLNRMAGSGASDDDRAKYGMYENRTSTGEQGNDTEYTHIATYITQQYYVDLGYDTSKGNVKDQASPAGGIGKGIAYTFDNIGNINFNVEPASLAESSANPDFPAGRWYMVHDTTGITGVQEDERSRKYSDALDTNVTQPGRYTYYFAPQEEDVKNGTLDPDTAIFDFVVNQRPVAQFTATISGTGTSKTLKITDMSYDPDSPSGPSYDSGVQLTGIVKREYKYQYLVKNDTSLVVKKETGWSTTSPNGQSLSTITGGDATLPDNSVLTVYMRVTDVAARRIAQKDSAGKVTGYTYVATNGAVSEVCQSNATEGVKVTYAPQSTITMTPVIIYDTASAAPVGAANRKVVLERTSSHPQGYNFSPSWAINLKDMGVEGKDATGYIPLEKSETNNDWLYGSEVALKCVQNPTPSGNIGDNSIGSTGGKWEMSYEFIKAHATAGKYIRLQLTEKVYGVSAATAAAGKGDETYITDQSARAVLFTQDKNPPSSQVVTAHTEIDGVEGEQEYAASTYLDVTNYDRRVVININGSEDKEGVLSGYGYYFYDKNATTGVETAWYRMDPATGKRVKVGSAALATQKLVTSNSSQIMQIKIGREAMLKEPTEALNVAIFAYDNQTGQSTETGANQSAKTRITDIKLSVSEPMPPEISVTNSMNQNVAHIGNSNGFMPSYKGYTSTPDAQTSDLLDFSGTNVTVQFSPRKAKYDLDANTGALTENTTGGGTEYYQDRYGAADMTGTANIRYSVRYKDREAHDWWTDADFIASPNFGAPLPKNETIASAQQLTYTVDGVYEITAAVVNGSGTVSANRTVKFTIDKTPPANLQVDFKDEYGSPYVSGTWTKAVTITASGATDTNADTSRYEYSKDGGKTWIEMGSLLQNSVEVTMRDSGQYPVQVRAIDRAGNQQLHGTAMTVKIDTTPPETQGPTLTATSVMRDVFDSYIVSLQYDSKGGEVHSIVEGDMTNESDWNKLDRNVAVPTGESVRFRLLPNDGYQVTGLVFNGGDIFDQIQENAQLGFSYVDINNVTADSILAVTFTKTDLDANTFRTVSTGVTAMKFAASITNKALYSGVNAESETPVAPIAGDEDDPGVQTYTVNVYTMTSGSDSGFGGTASADRTEVPAGDSVLISMRANTGYRVSKVEVNGVDVDLKDLQQTGRTYTYLLSPVVQDTDVYVTFEQIHTRTVQLSYNDCGTAFILENSNVTSLGGGKYSAEEGTDITIQMDPLDGYGVKSLLIDNEVPSGYFTGDVSCTYHVGPYEGEGTDPGIHVEITFDVTATAKRRFDVSVGPSESDGLPHGTITANGLVNIPVNGVRTFTIIPDPTYRVDKVLLSTYVEEEEMDTEDVSGELKMISSDPRQYTYTLSDPHTVGPEGSANDGTLQVIFEKQTYKLSATTNTGGSVSVKPTVGDGLSLNAIPEGIGLIFTFNPKDGYRVKSVKITESDGISTSRTSSLGAVSSYTIENVHSNIAIEVEFVERIVSHIETTHAIMAVANNIKDADDALNDLPYRFCIADAPEGTPGRHVSEWSEWSASNTITYTGIRVQGSAQEIPLDPDKVYYVYVMTRDRVGNVSDGSHYSTVYSLANMPGAISAEALDDGGKYAGKKSVSLVVDPNGNPSGTKYMVYHSNSSSMTDMAIANKTDDNTEEDCWSELGIGNTFVIDGLEPGRWYYFQVVARNHEGYSTQISKDIVGIMLSPAAPPENSFYFEDQTSPVSPVVLRWNEPEGEVSAIQIYRDGMFLKELDVDTLFYSDDKINFPGDSIVKYSYAYVNSAGVGSSRSAVSKEYYQAYSDVSGTADPEKQAKLEAWADKAGGYENLFSETMTYPVFHYGAKEPISASQSRQENSGTITVQMRYDATESGRYQKYKLKLRAYSRDTGIEETDSSKWLDPDKVNQSATTTKLVQETKVNVASGETAARATWTNLSTQYQYDIVVEEILSTGAGQGGTSSGAGQNSPGVEYTLGKTYVVNRNGYNFYYANDTESLLKPGSGTWTPEGLAEYTRYAEKGWDTPVNTKPITFNMSPEIELADTANRYAGNAAEKIKTANGKDYLLVDQNMEDKTFQIKVAAWDEDGTREDSNIKPSIKGTIARVPGVTHEFADGESMPASEAIAKQPGNLYPITFDASGLSTGVYTEMEMRAADSDTETIRTTNDILLVVNRHTPYSYVKRGEDYTTTKRLQNEVSYNKDTLVEVESRVASDGLESTDLTKVALMVMSDKYQQVFGTSDYNTLYNYLVNGTNSAAVTAAKNLLANRAPSGNTLTVELMNLAVARVAPPVTRYITVTEEQYQQLPAEVLASDQAFMDEGSKTTYWLELDYALNNGLCSWLEKVDANTVKPNVKLGDTDKENTYMMKLVAHFGGNTTSQTVDFIIRPAPSTEILSKKSFVWQDTAQAEYEFFEKQNRTIQDVVNLYDGCYIPGQTEMEEDASSSAPAYRKNPEDNSKYQVYKLVDSEGNVGNDFISGKVRTNLGIHSQLKEVGVLLLVDKTYDPNTGGALPSSAIESPVYDNYSSPITVGGDLRFSISNLTPGATYYLWSYYKVNDSTPRVYSEGYVALTTMDAFDMAQYGFSKESYSYKEMDYPNGIPVRVSISKLGSTKASATVRITPEYYEADQHGVLLLDENEQPIPLTGTALEYAKQTLHFNSGNAEELITFGNKVTDDVVLMLKDNYLQQGHMIVRLKLTIENSDAGYCYVTNGGGYTDIFVQDDESPVTSYILSVINENENGEKFMKESVDAITGKLNHYEYQFDGLQVGYSQISTVMLTYENKGTGDLEDITVTVYEDREGTKVSPYFVAETPSETNLKQVLGGRGTVEIHPISGLEDGVYEGWVQLTAQYVEDPVRIKVRQVVGQSTLRGRIYITPDMPDLNTRTGSAKISLYDAGTARWDDSIGKFLTEPDYVVYSDEYGGEFEIPNILNKGAYSNGQYYVIIERDGFLTFNSRKYRPGAGFYWMQLGTESKSYTFNLRLIGGDVNGDQVINDTDMNTLVQYYNRLVDVEGTPEEINAIIRRCDFNEDGVVNALDRMFLTGNMGSKDSSYPYGNDSTYTRKPDE